MNEQVCCNVVKKNVCKSGMKTVLVLSSLTVDETAQYLGCKAKILQKEAIVKVETKEADTFVAVCSPLTRYLAYTIMPSCNEVHIVYKPSSTLSRLRARKWIQPTTL